MSEGKNSSTGDGAEVYLQDWNMQVIHRDDNLDFHGSPAPSLAYGF